MREHAMRVKKMADFMHKDIKRCSHVFQPINANEALHAVQACERKKNHVVGKIPASSMLYYHN
jgi:hypothetical protein